MPSGSHPTVLWIGSSTLDTMGPWSVGSVEVFQVRSGKVLERYLLGVGTLQLVG